MRTDLEFRSTAFPAYPSEDQEVNPGRYGKRLAEFLAEQLPGLGFPVKQLIAEDSCWIVSLKNPAFPLWIGCGNYDEYPDGFLCFIVPSKPVIYRWFSRIETRSTVEKLADALENVLQQSGKVSDLRWWTTEEVRRG